jgi:hypothetical protein
MSLHAEIFGIKDLICQGIDEDSFGMYAGLVGKCAGASN